MVRLQFFIGLDSGLRDVPIATQADTQLGINILGVE